MAVGLCNLVNFQGFSCGGGVELVTMGKEEGCFYEWGGGGALNFVRRWVGVCGWSDSGCVSVRWVPWRKEASRNKRRGRH
jgi:hypothetical protein